LAKKIIDLIFFGSIFISLCTVALCIETNLLLGIPLNHYSFYLFVFGATLSQYNLHYLVKTTAIKGSERLAWSATHKTLHKILIVTGAILCFYSLFYFTITHFLIVGLMAIVAFFYSYPALPFRRKKRLKDYGFLKICTLAFLWTMVTVWFPLDQVNTGGTYFQLVFLRRFLFMFVLCLVFDLRDIDADVSEHRRTIPVVIGIRRSYLLCYVLLVIFVLLSAWQLALTGNLLHFNAMLLSALATAFMIHWTRKNSSDYIYLAGIDGMMLLQAALIAIGSLQL